MGGLAPVQLDSDPAPQNPRRHNPIQGHATHRTSRTCDEEPRPIAAKVHAIPGCPLIHPIGILDRVAIWVIQLSLVVVSERLARTVKWGACETPEVPLFLSERNTESQ
jgi:hypothetical protein